jgi:hypothetical protein
MSVPMLGPVPTDSFYKFLAVAGVSLMISSGIVKERNLETLLGANREFLVLGARRQSAQHQMNEAKIRIHVLDSLQARGVQKERDSLNKTIARSNLYLQALDSAGFATDFNAQDSAATWKRLDRVTDFAFFLGLAMALYGFVAWAWRIQRPADMVAAAEGVKAGLAKAQAELELKALTKRDEETVPNGDTLQDQKSGEGV